MNGEYSGMTKKSERHDNAVTFLAMNVEQRKNADKL